MRKSSIHIERADLGEFYHNDRSKPTKNSIFSTKDNYCNRSGKDAMELYFLELKKRTELYQKRTGKKLHKKAITLFSSIINLNEKHTEKDLEKIVKFIEKRYNTKVIQFALHKDEGHIDENGNHVINYHAHVLFLGIDNHGASVRRKMDRKDLIDLQDKIAEILNMPRGINYTKEKKKRPKRLDTYEYKEHARRTASLLEKNKKLREELEKEKITKKQVEEELRNLRQELINKNKQLEEQNKQKIYTQEDYKSLTALKKELKANNAQEIYKKFRELRSKLENKAKKLEEENKSLKSKIKELKEQAKELQRQVEELKEFIYTYTLTIKHNITTRDKTLYLDLNEYSYKEISENVFKINYDWGYAIDDAKNNIIKIKIFAPKNNQEERIYKAVEDVCKLLKDKEIDSNIQIESDNEELKEILKDKIDIKVLLKKRKNKYLNDSKFKM